MRERIDFGTRVAGEKARLADEFITKSQLIAGTGVTLDVQDNYDIMVSMDINQGMQYMMVEQGADSSASDTDPISNMLSFSTNGNSLYQVEYTLEVNVMLASTLYIFLSGNPTMAFKGYIEQTSSGSDQFLNSPTTAQRTIFDLGAGDPITTKTIFPGFKTTLIRLRGYIETGNAGGIITLSIGSSIMGNYVTLADRSYLFVTPMIVENYGEPPTDEKVGIVYGDTAGYLSEKIVAGDGIDVSIDDTDPSNQTLVISNTARNKIEICRVATTGNILLDGSVTEIDDITLLTNDIVLVNFQDEVSENSIYICSLTGPWTRLTPLHDGMLVCVGEGSTNENTVWQLSTYFDEELNTDIMSFVKVLPYKMTGSPNYTTRFAEDGELVQTQDVKSYAYSPSAYTILDITRHDQNLSDTPDVFKFAARVVSNCSSVLSLQLTVTDYAASMQFIRCLTTGLSQPTVFVVYGDGRIQSAYYAGSGDRYLGADSTGHLKVMPTPVMPTPVLSTTKRTLTPNEIRALHTTPIELIAAPGENKLAKIISGTILYNYDGTEEYTGSFSICYDSVYFNEAVYESSIYLSGNYSNIIPTHGTDNNYDPSVIVNKNITAKANSAITNNDATGTVVISLTYEIVDLS